jgi:hypothetical protein
MPNFADRRCHVVRVTDLYVRILDFLDRHCYSSSKQLLNCTQEAEWTLPQTLYLSENVVTPEIEPGPLDL